MDEQLQLTSVISENSFVVNEEEILESNSYIKVLGVGGAGTNAVNNMDKKHQQQHNINQKRIFNKVIQQELNIMVM